MKKSADTMRRRIGTLQKELGQVGPVMRGSVVVIGTRNKQPYFSLNKDKRTRLIYLGQKRVGWQRWPLPGNLQPNSRQHHGRCGHGVPGQQQPHSLSH